MTTSLFYGYTLEYYDTNIQVCTRKTDLPLRVVQTICRILAERNIDLDPRPLPMRGVDIEQAVHQFRAFAQVDHSQTPALIIRFVDRRHIKAQSIIFDFQ